MRGVSPGGKGAHARQVGEEWVSDDSEFNDFAIVMVQPPNPNQCSQRFLDERNLSDISVQALRIFISAMALCSEVPVGGRAGKQCLGS
jgi:hypothetical protein